MSNAIHECHVCGGPGHKPKSDETNKHGRCYWCNGTGDEDYQDRAYETERDSRNDLDH